MAHLWMQDDERQWGIMPLEQENYRLTAGAVRGRHPHGARGETWLIESGCGREVSVNGRPLWLGLRVLRDKDQICVPAVGRFYFATERLAKVEPFPGATQPVYCARCKELVEPGALSVQCPQCGTWHHQSDDLPCWTYAERCALCDQPTALDGRYRWTPEEQ